MKKKYKPWDVISPTISVFFRRKIIILILAVMQSVVMGVNAQDKHRVTGTITGSEGEPIIGANIIIKGTSSGVISDVNGRFAIEASPSDVLVVSFIGYVTEEIAVGTRSVIDIRLSEDVQTLGEVVVVGYGTMKKSDLTGAVASVSGDALRGSVVASPDQALQGRIAGVQVTQNTGQPGGAVSIRIRGTTSLTGSSEPLYVIDGIQMVGDAEGIPGFDWQGGSGGQQEAGTNPLANLNPNDIASIEVLKDASATAIYGSRAAAGVVIITTKRGQQGQANVSYNGYYALQHVYKTFDMMDLPTYAQYNNEIAQQVSTIAANPNFADPSLLGPGTDWLEAIFRVAPMQHHSITISGGSDKTSYYVSGGYFEQEGIIIGSNFNRFNVRVNLDSKVKDWISLGASIALSRKDEKIINNDGGDGVISQAAQMPPHIPVKNFDGSYAGPDQQNVSAQIGSNPVAQALLRNNTVLENRALTNLFADFQLVKGLTFRSELSANYGNYLNRSFNPSYKWGTLTNPVSQLGQASNQNFNWQWRNYATYVNSFGNHSLHVTLGQEAQKVQWDNFTAYKIGVPNDIPVMNQGDVSNVLNTGSKGWDSKASYFARVNYNFADRYLITGTIRRDGSSKFGPANRWGWFPSASVGWRISQEDFMKGISFIDNLKLRVGWGMVGNDGISQYAFGSALTPLPSYFGNAVRNRSYSNPFVQWESTRDFNIGLDLAMFDNRVELILEGYDRETDNLLLRVQLPATFGDQVEGPQANVGSMTNKGIEATLNTVNLHLNKFKWTTSANFTLNRNKITNLGGTPIFENVYWYSGFQTAMMTDAGYPVGQFYGYVMDGIFKSKEEILNHAVQIPDDDDPTRNKIERTTGVWLGDIKWRDLNKDGKINSEDQTVIGDPNPDWTFGFNNSFTLGPFSLDVYAIGSIGGDILNFSRTRNEQMIGNFDNQSITVLNRAQTRLIEGGSDPNNIDHVELINPDTKMPRFDNGGENFNHYMSSRWIEDGTYVRIQNIRLGYTLPENLTRKARISKAHIYANVQNAFTFTNYSGLDPQIGAFNQSPLQQNVDMGRYPSPRVYTLGVNVDF